MSKCFLGWLLLVSFCAQAGEVSRSQPHDVEILISLKNLDGNYIEFNRELQDSTLHNSRMQEIARKALKTAGCKDIFFNHPVELSLTGFVEIWASTSNCSDPKFEKPLLPSKFMCDEGEFVDLGLVYSPYYQVTVMDWDRYREICRK